MAVTLRLARHGKKKQPFYRIVAAESESPRDGRFIEKLGFYNPMVEPPIVQLKEDRVRRWVGIGAQTTALVRSLIKKQIPGIMEDREQHQDNMIKQRRKNRKQRSRARAA